MEELVDFTGRLPLPACLRMQNILCFEVARAAGRHSLEGGAGEVNGWRKFKRVASIGGMRGGENDFEKICC